jgi:hypothetical protein
METRNKIALAWTVTTRLGVRHTGQTISHYTTLRGRRQAFRMLERRLRSAFLDWREVGIEWLPK